MNARPRQSLQRLNYTDLGGTLIFFLPLSEDINVLLRMNCKTFYNPLTFKVQYLQIELPSRWPQLFFEISDKQRTLAF